MTDLYQSQRAMRQMRRQAMQRGVVAILDVVYFLVRVTVLAYSRLASSYG